MKFFNDAKLKFGVWNRERKERAEARKADHQDPANVTIPLSLVRSTKLAAWMAYFSLVYFLWLYTLDIARDRAASLHLTHVGGWIGDIQFYFPYIVGFAVVAVGIPYVAKIAIPTFMSLSWRGNFWPKLWALLIALAVSLVVIAGTFTVQGDTIMERDRDAAVAVEGVEQEAAVLAARIADTRAELDDMVNNSSVYVRTAASMSPEAYDVFVEQRRDDWQYQRLLSYRATSVDAERLRNEITALRDQQARQTTVASVQGEVVTERTGWIAYTLGWLEGVRAILLSLVMDIVCLIMPWIALRLEQARNRQLGMADEAYQSRWVPVEDKRNQPNPAHQSAQEAAYDVLMSGGSREDAAEAARAATRPAPNEKSRRVFNAETGREEVWVQPKGHWRPTGKQRKNADGSTLEQMEFKPEPLPDETGVATDGGQRTAVALATAESAPQQPENGEGQADLNEQAENDGEAQAEIDPVAAHPSPEQTQPPELSEQEAAELEELAALVEAESAAADEVAGEEQGGEADDNDRRNDEPEHHEPSDQQPQTREDRMLAPPSVAAE